MEKRLERDQRLAIERVDKWFIDNNGTIASIMEDHRQRMLTLIDADDFNDFDINKRNLSEMALCWSLMRTSSEIPLPGFVLLTPAHGWAEVAYPALGYAGKEGVGHGFFWRDDLNVVACLTFGQFIEPLEESTRPGEKVAVAQGLAPELVMIFGNLAMLRGDKEEIAQELGLNYRSRDLYE